MKEQDPFNPAVPVDFQLAPETSATEQSKNNPVTANLVMEPSPASANSKRSSRKTAGTRKRKATVEPNTPKISSAKISWEILKEKINGRLGSLDKEKLKTALIACGLSAAVVAAVVLLVKLFPVAVVLLSLVGLAMVMQIWRRLSRASTLA